MPIEMVVSMTKWCHNYVEGITLWLQIAAISNPSAWTVLVLQQKAKSQEKLRLWEDVGRYFLAKAKFTCIVSMQCRWTNVAFILTFAIILVYCRPLSTQIIVQTDVVQAIFSHVLMVARAVRHVTSREKDLTAPVIRVFKENVVKSVGMICFS